MNGLTEEVPLPRPPATGIGPSRFGPGNAILLALGYAPLLLLFFLNLWGRPHYQFFPLALAGAGFLAWVRLKENSVPFESGAPLLSVILFGLSFVCLAVATLFWSPWLGTWAALLGLLAVLWLLGGRNLWRVMTPALLLVLAIIPPPLALDSRFAEQLRVLAVNWSSHLLDLASVTHSQSGNVLELPGQTLLVEEACSGINSVLVTMAGCLFYMLWRRASTARTVLCLLGTISFVLLGNLVRITVGAWLKFRYGIEVLSGWPHQLIGVALFVMYMGLIFSLDRWLLFLSSPSRRRRHAQKEISNAEFQISNTEHATRNTQHATLITHRPPRIAVWPRLAACSFALLGVAQLGRGWIHHQESKTQLAIPKSALKDGATFIMPDQVGRWRRLSTESPLLQKVETMGVFSQIWHFQQGETVASVALDYPFSGYHDVALCYTLRGWKVSERLSGQSKGPKMNIPYAQVQMQNELGRYGSLWFSTVDETGHWLETPTLERSFMDRWKLPGKTERTSYRVQVLVTSYASLPKIEEEQAQELFEEARSLLWQQLSAQMRRQP